MLLNPSPISSLKFSFKNNTFVTEASDLGRGFDLGQVYDDACDKGFTIISEKTGKGAVFVLWKDETDHEGYIVSWIFKCVTPGLTNLKAVIFDD